MLARPGDDLLSRALRRSTIGAEGLNGRVRNGIGCGPLAITTRSCKHGPLSIGWVSSFLRRLAGAGGRPLRGRLGAMACPNWAVAPGSGSGACRCTRRLPAPKHGHAIKPIERLVPVSCMRCRTSTSGLSTWWSSTALKRDLVSRWASRLDAFSSYPVRT